MEDINAVIGKVHRRSGRRYGGRNYTKDRR
jgi:hypothetical protein